MLETLIQFIGGLFTFGMGTSPKTKVRDENIFKSAARAVKSTPAKARGVWRRLLDHRADQT